MEISEGHGSEDFRLAARVDAFDGSDAAVATRHHPRGPVGAAPEVLRTVVLGLSPGSEFDVRVTAISRYGSAAKLAELPGRWFGGQTLSTREIEREGERERGREGELPDSGPN